MLIRQLHIGFMCYLLSCGSVLPHSLKPLLVPTILNKCCPEGQQLTDDFRTCVQDENYFDYTDSKEVNIDSKLPRWIVDVTIQSIDNQNNFSYYEYENKSHLNIGYGYHQPCSQEFITLSILSEDYVIYDNGSLVVAGTTYHGGFDTNVTYPPTSYCVDQVDLSAVPGIDKNDSLKQVILLCPCDTVTCVRKCCPPGTVLSVGESRHTTDTNCVASETAWSPEVVVAAGGPSDNATDYALVYGFPECDDLHVLNLPGEEASPFWVLSDGSLVAEKAGSRWSVAGREHCADAGNAVYCWRGGRGAKGALYGALFAAGALFLAATLLAYAALPELRSLHARTLMAHTAALLGAYAGLAAAQLRSLPPALCVPMAFVVQFSFLAAFFWLNVMCIDISWAFSGLRPPQGSATERDHKKFVWYSVYAWGTTAAISVVTAIVEFVPAIPPTDFKPDFGVSTCWFNGKISTLTFFYGPMALLLICNLILFIFTASRIIIVKRDTSILHKQDSRCHTGRTPTLSSSAYKRDKKRLVLYAKLFCLMGLTWITEIISWLVGGPAYYWYVTDFINLFRAVFIFVMFCCKPNVVRLLRMRLWGACPWCPCALAASPSDLPSDTGKANSTSSIKLTNGIRKMITSNTSNSSIQTANGRTQETAT